MNLTEFRNAIEALIRDAGGVLSASDRDFFVREAVKRYSRSKPRIVVADIAGSGAFDYAMPAGFDTEFSQVQRVEYPAGEREPVIVDRLDWRLYRQPNGVTLRFTAATPQVGETIRVTFTALHTVDAETTTVPAADHDIVHMLGSALACEALASHYSNSTSSTIGADAVDHRSQAAEYALRAKRFWSAAGELLREARPNEAPAAGRETSWGDDMPLLTHPQR